MKIVLGSKSEKKGETNISEQSTAASLDTETIVADALADEGEASQITATVDIEEAIEIEREIRYEDATVSAEASENEQPEIDPTMRAEVLWEDTAKRNENAQHFVRNDNTTKAVFTAYASHYLDATTGEYKKVDNALADIGDALENKANTFKARFRKDLPNGVIYEMTKGNSRVVLVADSVGHNPNCTLENCDCGQAAQATVAVREAAQNVDISYDVESDKIKENIIVKGKSPTYIYDFHLAIDNLSAELSEDGKNLVLKNKTTGEADFIIPPPFMFDANLVYSEDVYFEIEKESDSVLQVKVIASEDFMNDEERAFPVIIDPQIISGDSALYTYKTYYRNVSSSSSSGPSNWYSTTSAYMRVSRSSTMEYKTELTVKKSKLNLKNHSVSKAILKLYPYNYTAGNCYLNGSLISINGYKYYEVDITSNVRNASGDFTVSLMPSTWNVNVNFYVSGSYAPILEVEYITNENTRPTIEEFSLAGCVSGALNLGTGEVTAAFGDAGTESSALSVDVSHMYKKNSSVTNFGKNWRLNLEQRLEKNDTAALNANYIYTDGNGNKHGFRDYYYYLDAANNKVYVSNKSSIIAEQDGRLTYAGHEVFKEQKTATGLKAVTQPEGFQNVDLLEQRQNEEIQLEKTVENYKNSLKDLVVVTTADGTIVRSLSGYFSKDELTKAQFDAFMKITSTQMVMPKSEALTLRNSRLQYEAMGLQNTALEYQITAMAQQITSMQQQDEAMENQDYSMVLQNCALKVQLAQLTYQHEKEEDEGQKNLIDGIGSPTDPDQKWVVQQQLNRLPQEQNLLGRQRTNLGSQKTNTENQKSNMTGQKTNASKQQILLLEQISYMYSKRALYIDQVEKLFGEYIRAKFQLSTLYKQVPVNYLTDENSVVRAFNRYGKLVAIYDSYENVMTITYDEKDRISAVYEGEEKKISFRYNYYGQLASITDARGRTTRYTYSSTSVSAGNLSTVTYADGRKITFVYDASGNISSVESSDKLKTTLTYSAGRPVAITDYSCIGSIAKGTTGAPVSEMLGKYSVAYQTYKTEITDAKGKKVCYVFNADGNVALQYTEQDGVLQDTCTHDFVSKTCSFTVKPKKEEQNLLASIASQTKSTAYLLYSIAGSALSQNTAVTDYMFGAYATANSFTTGMRMQTEFYSQNMTSTIAAKFEIRASVVYPTTTKQFIASFDYSNKNKQYAAVPVTLDEDANGNAIIPVRIDLYVDYASNNGSAVFDTFTFQPAEWEYVLLNAFDSPTLSETSWEKISATKRVKSETVYTYDNDQRLVRERVKKSIATIGGTIQHKYSVTDYAYNPNGNISRTENRTEGEETEKGIDIVEYEYDAKGNKVREICYNSLDGTTKFYTEAEVAENGTVMADIDDTGENKTRYEYVAGTNAVRTAHLPNGGKYSYGYSEYGEVTGITQSTADGEENAVKMHCDYGLVTELASGLHTVRYNYDAKRRKSKIVLDGDEMQAVSYAYADASAQNGYVDTVTVTKNGVSGETRTDRNGNLLTLKVKEGDAAQVTYQTNTFDADGRQLSGTDNRTGSKVTYTYDSVIKNRVTAISRTAGMNVAALTEENTYDALGQLERRTVSGAVAHTYAYHYKENAAMDLDYILLPNGLKAYPQHDVCGRVAGKILVDAGGNKKYGEYLSYRKVGDHGTNTVSTMRYGRATAEGGYVIDDCLQYKYDACGNIAEIRENGRLCAKYTYDALQRLVREDNRALGATVLWTYDNFGNILYKRTADYTVKQAEEIPSFREEIKYAYDGKHPDRLVGFGEQSIAYNEKGLPKSYRGKTLAWSAIGQLTSYGDTAYTYDGNGRRTKKGDLVFTYDLGGRLVKQSNGLEFFYDGNGLTGLRYNDTHYIYRKNAQGDIAAILDGNGKIMVKYAYDAWGNCTITDTSGINLGNLNPFRYRSYYYDGELYYLQARYYDPETGRFLSQDDVSHLDSENLGGLNLYAYCLNNPVVMNDPEGTAPKWWQWLINGLILAVGVVLCATGFGTALGVSLLVAGGSMLASNIMSAAGVNGKVASIVSSALNIVAGIALCFTPFAAMGASMIGSGIGGIAGGFISEALGFSFEAGAMIGGLVGSIVGGQVYKGVQNVRAINFLKAQGIDSNRAKEYVKSFDLAPTFKKLKTDTTVYRVWGNKAKEIGHFVSPKTYKDPIKALALNPDWGNTAQHTSKLVIQGNTKILVGWAARQGSLRGGGLQWFVTDLTRLKIF